MKKLIFAVSLICIIISCKRNQLPIVSENQTEFFEMKEDDSKKTIEIIDEFTGKYIYSSIDITKYKYSGISENKYFNVKSYSEYTYIDVIKTDTNTNRYLFNTNCSILNMIRPDGELLVNYPEPRLEEYNHKDRFYQIAADAPGSMIYCDFYFKNNNSIVLDYKYIDEHYKVVETDEGYSIPTNIDEDDDEIIECKIVFMKK